jgi:hypothetical protein
LTARFLEKRDGRHCEERIARRSNLVLASPVGPRLLRFARNAGWTAPDGIIVPDWPVMNSGSRGDRPLCTLP